MLTIGDPGAEADLDPYMFGTGQRRTPSEGPDPRLRLGIQFSNGRKATFVCAWSAASVPVTRHEIDAQLLLGAARRAQQIFEAEPRSEGSGNWTCCAVGVTRTGTPEEPKPGES